MSARGYSVSLATGCVAAGGTLGALVPPSIPLIFYALLTEQSIGILFVAAVVPALLAVLLYMITVTLYVRLVPGATPPQDRPRDDCRDRAGLQEGLGRRSCCWFSWSAASTAASIPKPKRRRSASAPPFCSRCSAARSRRTTIFQVMGETTATTAMIYLIISGVLTFSFFVGVTGLPQQMATLIDGVALPPIVIIVIILISISCWAR